MRSRILMATFAVTAVAAGWWFFSRPRTITVCVFTDAAFRQRAGWNEVLKSRIEAVSRIYEGQVGIRWKAADLSRSYPTTALSGLDQVRLALAHKTDCPADLLLGITGLSEGSRTASVSPFSHAAVIVDDPRQSESRNTLVLAHELAHLFGAVHDTGSDTLMADRPVKETFSPTTAKLIRRLRDYDFAQGVKGLDGAADGRAVDALREALVGLTPQPVLQAHKIIAAAMQADGENVPALRHLQAAVKIDPQSVSARFDLAVALERNSREDLALDTLREGVKLNPGSARLHSALGAVLLTRNRDEAIDEFMASLRLDPNNAALYATLGEVLADGMGRIDAAILAYQDALKLAPGLMQAQQGLDRAIASRAQAEKDAITMRRDAAQNPNNPGASYGLGVAEARAGNIEPAIKAFEHTTRLQPQFGLAHSSLALMYYLHGDYAKAWTEVDAARAGGSNPEQAFIDALRRKLPPQ